MGCEALPVPLTKTNVPCAAAGVGLGEAVGDGLGDGLGVAVGEGVATGGVGDAVGAGVLLELTLPQPARSAIVRRLRTDLLWAEIEVFIRSLHQGKVGCCWMRAETSCCRLPP